MTISIYQNKLLHLQNTQIVYKYILSKVVMQRIQKQCQYKVKSNLYICILIFNEPAQAHKRFNIVHEI